MTYRDRLDLAYVVWGRDVGFPELDMHLASLGVPPDEGPAAQARQDAMLAN